MDYYSVLKIKKLKRSNKYAASTNLSIYYTWKSNTNKINLKYHFRHGMKNLNYLTDHILYLIFQTILNIA